MNDGYLARKLLQLNRLLVDAESRLGRVLSLECGFNGRPSESEYAGTVRALRSHLAELQQLQMEVLKSLRSQAPADE